MASASDDEQSGTHPTKLGMANWTLVMYDGTSDQFFVGNASTIIR